MSSCSQAFPPDSGLWKYLEVVRWWACTEAHLYGTCRHHSAHLSDLSEQLHGFAAGMCFGHRKLIQLSPKKTWEGFIGGCITTVVASWYLAGFMSRFKWMTCPRTVRHLLVFGAHTCLLTFLLVRNFRKVESVNVRNTSFMLHQADCLAVNQLAI